MIINCCFFSVFALRGDHECFDLLVTGILNGHKRFLLHEFLTLCVLILLLLDRLDIYGPYILHVVVQVLIHLCLLVFHLIHHDFVSIAVQHDHLIELQEFLGGLLIGH